VIQSTPPERWGGPAEKWELPEAVVKPSATAATTTRPIEGCAAEHGALRQRGGQAGRALRGTVDHDDNGALIMVGSSLLASTRTSQAVLPGLKRSDARAGRLELSPRVACRPADQRGIFRRSPI
jgi:hypothetical protein